MIVNVSTDLRDISLPYSRSSEKANIQTWTEWCLICLREFDYKSDKRFFLINQLCSEALGTRLLINENTLTRSCLQEGVYKVKSYRMSSLAVAEGRPFSICSTSIFSTPSLKNGLQPVPSPDSIFSLISFKVNVSVSSASAEGRKTYNIKHSCLLYFKRQKLSGCPVKKSSGAQFCSRPSFPAPLPFTLKKCLPGRMIIFFLNLSPLSIVV